MTIRTIPFRSASQRPPLGNEVAESKDRKPKNFSKNRDKRGIKVEFAGNDPRVI